MKKVKLTGKLFLNKETIAHLNNEQMNHLRGGTDGAKPIPGIDIIVCKKSGDSKTCSATTTR